MKKTVNNETLFFYAIRLMLSDTVESQRYVLFEGKVLGCLIGFLNEIRTIVEPGHRYDSGNKKDKDRSNVIKTYMKKNTCH